MGQQTITPAQLDMAELAAYFQAHPTTGVVSSVAVTGNNGIGVSGSPITSTGTIILSLGAITPTSIVASGAIQGSNFSSGASVSGTNTGDQTITLTGDVTGSGTGSFATTLAASGVVAGSYGSSSAIPVLAVDSKGRITSVTTASVSAAAGGSSGQLQYNNSGSLGGVVNVTYVSTSPNFLTLGSGSNAFSLFGPQGAASNAALTFQAGSLSTGAGAQTTVSGGAAFGTAGAGGNAVITGGNGGSSTGAAGSVVLQTGTAQAGQTGGSISFSTAPGGSILATRLTIDQNGAWNLAGSSPGTSGQVLTSQGTGTAPTWTTVGAGTGTVTSVALSDGSTTPIYSISGSPVTTSGTLDFTLKTQNANLVFAGPASGSAAQPSFRSLVTADFPASGVTAGSYTSTNITVDSTGRVTSASNGSGGGGIGSVITTGYQTTTTSGTQLASAPSSSNAWSMTTSSAVNGGVYYFEVYVWWNQNSQTTSGFGAATPVVTGGTIDFCAVDCTMTSQTQGGPTTAKISNVMGNSGTAYSVFTTTATYDTAPLFLYQYGTITASSTTLTVAMRFLQSAGATPGPFIYAGSWSKLTRIA